MICGGLDELDSLKKNFSTDEAVKSRRGLAAVSITQWTRPLQWRSLMHPNYIVQYNRVHRSVLSIMPKTSESTAFKIYSKLNMIYTRRISSVTIYYGPDTVLVKTIIAKKKLKIFVINLFE